MLGEGHIQQLVTELMAPYQAQMAEFGAGIHDVRDLLAEIRDLLKAIRSNTAGPGRWPGGPR